MCAYVRTCVCMCVCMCVCACVCVCMWIYSEQLLLQRTRGWVNLYLSFLLTKTKTFNLGKKSTVICKKNKSKKKTIGQCYVGTNKMLNRCKNAYYWQYCACLW